MGSSSPLVSPSSDKRFWSTLRSRVDTLLDARQPRTSSHSPKVGVAATLYNRSIFQFLIGFSKNLIGGVFFLFCFICVECRRKNPVEGRFYVADERV